MVTNLKRPLIISTSIILVSVIAAAIGLYIFAGKIGTTADKIVKDKALIDQQTGALAVVASLKNQVPQANAYEIAMAKLLPTQDGLIDFSQWIRLIASQHQVLVSVSFSGDNVIPPSGTTSGQAGFSFSVSGDIDSIIAFLDDIESQSPGFLLQVNSYDLSNVNGGYQLNGHGVVFFQQ